MTTRARTASPSFVTLLLRAAHVGPTVAVTTLVAMLAIAAGLSGFRTVILTAAVLAGQLTVGWGNDLVDADRDRQVGRGDKPLVSHELSPAVIKRWLVGMACVCVALSLSVGWRSGTAHLLLGVTSGHLYNVYLKSTRSSWLPYAVAFGALPAVVYLADAPAKWPPLWMVAAAATLGVAAHFLNTLPDLAADISTGVRGLPHRIGAARSRLVATGLLIGASALTVFGPTPAPWAWPGFAVAVALAAVALFSRGKTPFHAAIAIAIVNVVFLIVGAR